jgi:hypothetical protein
MQGVISLPLGLFFVGLVLVAFRGFAAWINENFPYQAHSLRRIGLRDAKQLKPFLMAFDEQFLASFFGSSPRRLWTKGISQKLFCLTCFFLSDILRTMQDVNTRELQKHTREVCERIAAGESLRWVKGGKTIAYISPALNL